MRFHLAARNIVLVSTVLIGVVGASVAQNFTVLHSFANGADGALPFGGLIRDPKGNLDGTTAFGGGGSGTIFKVTPAGAETVLYSFSYGEGENPYLGLVGDGRGNFYGGTYWGGSFGEGIVFELSTRSMTAKGVVTILHNFGGDGDSSHPSFGNLLRDDSGDLFGTTEGISGTEGDFGSVFKIDNLGKELVLYKFQGGSDGWSPQGGLITDGQGNLYGTTFLAGC